MGEWPKTKTLRTDHKTTKGRGPKESSDNIKCGQRKAGRPQE